jgi:hypothetical protein
MAAPTDPAKVRAVLDQLEAEDARRLAERIAADEVIAVDLFIVAGSKTSARIQVEAAKTAKLKELHDGGDQREVVFRVDTVVTGVVQHGEARDPASVPTAPSFSSREDAPRPPLPSPVIAADVITDVVDQVREEPQPPVIETYIWVQTRRCRDDDDPGEICEGWYSIDNKVVTVTGANGKYVGSRVMLAGEDARAVAKQLLREKNPEGEDFNRRIYYSASGVA